MTVWQLHLHFHSHSSPSIAPPPSPSPLPLSIYVNCSNFMCLRAVGVLACCAVVFCVSLCLFFDLCCVQHLKFIDKYSRRPTEDARPPTVYRPAPSNHSSLLPLVSHLACPAMCKVWHARTLNPPTLAFPPLNLSLSLSLYQSPYLSFC